MHQTPAGGRRRFLGGLSIAALGALPAVRTLAADAPLAPVKFALNRGPYDASNAPFLLARERGWFAAEGLAVDLSLSKNVVDAIRRVASNECDFGYADFAVVMRFAAENPDSAPHLLYSIFDRSPAAIVTWKSAGVRTVHDLPGKTLAATVGDGAYQLFPAFCRANNFDPKRVKIVEVGLEEREDVMHERKVDGAIGFDSTILYKLVHAGARRDEVGFLHYADAGLPLYSNGIIVSRKALAEKKPLIAGLVRACARGWHASLMRPAAMLAVLGAANPKADLALESERFEWVRDQQIATANVKKNGMGTIDIARFEHTAALLLPGMPVDKLARIIEGGYLPPLAERGI
jgi:NitT/TauT family transport system substrate-binding protein